VEVRKINTHNREKKLDDIVYDDFISTLRQIKEGNHQLREEFISEYKPFILKVTSNATGNISTPATVMSLALHCPRLMKQLINLTSRKVIISFSFLSR